jgi:hypothetical protein
VLPRADVARIRKLCAERASPEDSDQVRVECEEDPRAVTVVEWRPPWREDHGPEWMRRPIARLRYVGSTGRLDGLLPPAYRPVGALPAARPGETNRCAP